MSYQDELLERIAGALELSADYSRKQLEEYKKQNHETLVIMAKREDREIQASHRAEMDFAMAKERHESFMRERRERELTLKKIQEGPLQGPLK